MSLNNSSQFTAKLNPSTGQLKND